MPLPLSYSYCINGRLSCPRQAEMFLGKCIPGASQETLSGRPLHHLASLSPPDLSSSSL